MTDKPENSHIDNDPWMDTQRLLDMGPPAEGTFDLEDILAEFGPPGSSRAGPIREPEAREESEPVPEPKVQEEPEAVPSETLPDEFENPFGDIPRPPGQWEEDAPDEPEAAAEPDFPPPPKEPEEKTRRKAEEPEPIGLEDIVASTVDAVKGEQEKRQERLRKRLEKARKKLDRRPAKKKEPEQTLPEVENEPQPGEEAVLHKRRHRECRKSLTLAVPALMLMWLPWILAQFDVAVPFFSDSADNAALCVLIPQAVITVLCWPVFRSALKNLRRGVWSICTTALLCTMVTLLDEMTLLVMPQRTDAAPLGGVAAALAVFALWGLKNWHKAMAETFRTAAMGEPSRVVDCCGAGIAKGAGRRKGFSTRANLEDSPAQWQRLLLPVLAAASLIFAVLSSIGQERSQDLLWCWSAILCASSSFVFPMAFYIPSGRLAPRLARAGAAVAGQYGAAALSASRRIVVTDSDLFPVGAVSLGGVKLYGEERGRAVSYAATLAVQGGGIPGRLFGDVCQEERIGYQELEHFHIHDHGGLSGMIRGETVLFGPPVFMRHMAVRLPNPMPSKPSVCLAVDGNLTALFTIKYTAADTVDIALRLLRRNGLQLVLASRDGNVAAKLLKARFGGDCGASIPELGERLNLSDPEREAEEPNGLLYREGLLPFASLITGSRRLCQTARLGNLLAVAGSVAGVLLGFYLTFSGRYNVLTPQMLLTYLLLWVVPMLPLVWTVDGN